ncbi:inositol monophosphatase [Motiliproteus sp. MSK22-1]|uniref:inositol monophosphatase family protein n=1 Tax=Motiliproteus sp. MSK22-1 TaxID=1897630 RepID=UPI0009765B16|nr:inositol monophosphatase [Motiliproteus sp. MSK22-1]OMH31807.1 hypothetical protein BGP75_16975 [Motiliproteus sp. MSK22-1]
MDQQLLDGVQQLVEETGAYQCSRFRVLPPGKGTRKQVHEYVSEVDLHSEEMLLSGLHKLLPDAGTLAEETGQSGNESLYWIVDPLDGTTNFLSGLDQFSISVSLVQDGSPVLGIVYRPQSREIYRSIKGSGLYLNGKKLLKANPQLALHQALIGTGFPYRSADLASAFFPCAQEVLTHCRGIRRMGSAALDLSYVASGFLQGFWETDLKSYDVASGLLFLQESGCLVTNGQGKPYDMHRDRLLVCGWPAVQPELLKIVKEYYQPVLEAE